MPDFSDARAAFVTLPEDEYVDALLAVGIQLQPCLTFDAQGEGVGEFAPHLRAGSAPQQQQIQRRLANTRQDELKERMIHGGYQLLCISIVGAKGSPCAQRVRGDFSSGRHTGHPSVTFGDNSPQGEPYVLR